MEDEQHFADPLKTALRKVMAIDFLHAYDAAYKDPSRPENQRLTETGLRGIVAISSGALLLRDDSATPRNIGDLDLVVAGDAAHYDRVNASQALHHTIAALCSAKQWHLHDAMAHYPQKRDRKLIYEMSREFSPADIHEILKNDKKYRLSGNDIAQLQKAAQTASVCSGSLKLDINTDSPKLDSPPHNLANQEVDILKNPRFNGVYSTSPYQMLAAKALDLNRASRNKPTDLLDFIAALRLLPDKKMTPETAAFMRDCYYKPGTRHRDLINLRQKMDGQPPIPETAMPPLFFTAPTDAIVDRYCKDFEWLYARGVLPNPITRDATKAMMNEAYEAMNTLYHTPHIVSQPTTQLVFPESVRKAFIAYSEKVQEKLKDKSDPYRHFEDLGFALSGRMKALLEQSAQQTENPTEQAQAKAILQTFSAIKAGKMPPYIVIENLPIDPVIPDPVKEGLDKEDNFSRGSKGPISEYTTIAVSGMCGLYPYVNIEMKDKGFVNQIIPRKSDTKDLAMEKSSRGAGFFDMHTDNCSMQDENVAPFFTLFGLREGKDSIDTTVVLRDEIIKKLSPEEQALIRKPIYHFIGGGAVAPKEGGGTRQVIRPILSERGGKPFFTCNLAEEKMRVVPYEGNEALFDHKPANHQAAVDFVKKLQRITEDHPDLCTQVRLAPGVMLLVDNHAVLHGRANTSRDIVPDTYGRWVQRTYMRPGEYKENREFAV